MHDFAERLRMRRARQAKSDDLSDYDVGTYPQELLIKRGIGLKGILLGATLLGTGIAAGAMLVDALKTKEVSPEASVIEKTITDVYDYDVEINVERK